MLDKPTYTPEQIAVHHSIDISVINKQLATGIKVESEHTSHTKIAREIALDHLYEDPYYYSKLQKMESG